MTKDAVIDVVHKTILGFFDLVADDSEEPMSEKDKLLLEVNKAVCNAIKDMPDEERKKGRWILENSSNTWADYRCSECDRVITAYHSYGDAPKEEDVLKDYPFCHCGAEMKGAER